MQAEVKAEENNQRHVKRATVHTWEVSTLLASSPENVIPHRVILMYSHAYQAHLEKNSVFLCGERTWWRHVLSSVEFFYLLCQYTS